MYRSFTVFIFDSFQNLTLLTNKLKANVSTILHVGFSLLSECKQAGQQWTQGTLRRMSGGHARHAPKNLTTTQIRTTNSLKEARIKLVLPVTGVHRDNGDPKNARLPTAGADEERGQGHSHRLT